MKQPAYTNTISLEFPFEVEQNGPRSITVHVEVEVSQELAEAVRTVCGDLTSVAGIKSPVQYEELYDAISTAVLRAQLLDEVKVERSDTKR